MTNAETNTADQDCGPVDPSMISAEMRKIYVCISNTLLEEGRRPSLEEVARTGRQWTHRIFALRHGRADVGTDLGAYGDHPIGV